MKLVFDVAGVLLQWRPAELVARLLPRHANDAAAAAHWVEQIFTGYGGDWGEFDRGTIEVPDLVQRIARRTGLALDEVQRVVDAVPHALQPIDETVALLGELHGARWPIYFLSNMPAPYVDHLEARHAFFGWFRDGLWSGRARAIKPEREIFELAARRFGDPAELFFMDDHLPNVEAARAAGWSALHFSGAAQCRSVLRERIGQWTPHQARRA